MRHFPKLLTAGFLFLQSILLCAQEKTISGVVRDDTGSPLEGVTVSVRGTTRGVQTTANGAFTIQAAKGNVLIVSYIGYETQEVRVGEGNTLTVRLRNANNQLGEVVVTAMDIKRNPRELGYSVQKLSGTEIAETQRENFLNSLQGRIAGATVTPTGGMAGASSQIVLRGFNSMAMDNSPLFVIDGIVVDNQTLSENHGGAGAGGALGLASARENRGNDYTNRIADINPNDIESITILKGPEATALYGSQASSGAIVITTRKGKANGRVGVTYDNSFRIQELTRFPATSLKYNSGTNGVYGATLNATSGTYFGPAYGTDVTTYDNLHNFFRTGFAQTHNLSAEYGKKNYTFRASGSYFNQESPVPNNTLKRYTARLTNTTKIGKYIDITPSVTFTKSTNDKPLRGASGYLLNLLVWPADDDIRNWQNENGHKVPLFNSNPNGELDNPLFNVNKNRSYDATDRFIGTLGVNINPFTWLSLAGRFGYDTYKSEGYTFFHPDSYYLNIADSGAQDNYYRKYYSYNHTLTATAKKKVGKFTGRLLIGNMWQENETSMYAVYGRKLKDLSRTDSNNTNPATRVRLLNAIRNNLPNYSRYRQVAYFGEASISYNNTIFLTYSHRFEESSVFPAEYRDYNYPAGSLSVIVSDLIPGFKGPIVDFMKLRGSLASTARSSSPYSNQSTFNQNTGSGGGFYYGFTNNNFFLKPERQQTYEIGTELRLFKSRISLDASYYNTLNKDQIVELFRSSYGTGFVLNTLNVGSTRNQGVEISLEAIPVQTNDFRWSVRFNFNKMWNKVLLLPANVPEFYVSDTWLSGNARGGLVVGGSTTSITSYGYARNTKGDILIDPATGIPVLESVFKLRGDRNPDFTLGTINSFSYKNWRLSFLWDLKVGGDIFNATDMYLTRQGRSLRTEDRKTPRIIEGVLRDGLEGTENPTRNNIVIVPYENQNYYTTMPEEEFIERDVNWFRLRDISLNYTFPSTGLLKNAKYIRSLSVFATANDLVLFTNYTGADPAVNGNTAGSRGVGAFGFDYGNIGAPISLNFGIRASF
jgi:TonB-linked SusC/RagA family outer membrane protein